MERKKALLVVAGGRALPDVIALFCVQPELLVFLTSEEGWHAEEVFESIAQSVPTCKNIFPIRNVSAYNFEAGKRACEQVCESYPEAEWEWIFAIGSGPKITCIAAYEVARQKGIPCLYIDTVHEKVVSLVKEYAGQEKDLFHLDIPRYMKIQRRTYRENKGTTAAYRSTVEQWGHMARELALSPDTVHFTFTLRKKDRKESDPVTLPSELATSPLLQTLEKTYNLIEIKPDSAGTLICTFTSSEAAHFLSTGDWLEIYVWHEAKLAHFVDDCQWGYRVLDGNAENELDLAVTYKAQLIIGECKTDYNPFKDKRKYLESLDSTANLLGGLYVTRVFITNQPKTREGYDSFKEQAEKRRIVVVTAEDLLYVGDILKREAVKPTYARI